MNPPLFAHQQAALDFIDRRWDRGQGGAVLNLWMGTGKTRVAIEAARRRGLRLILVLCPLAAVEVWVQQFRRWAPEYDVLALDDRAGTVAQRVAAAAARVKWASEHGRPLVIAINYASAWREAFAKWAMKRSWPLVIADEIQCLKMPSGSTSRFSGRLSLFAMRRLGLTGTFMPHSPLDTWAQMRFIDRNVLDPTYTAFRLRYAVMHPKFPSKVEKWKDLEGLARRLEPAVFQVGPEVLDLPGEQDETLCCNLSREARRMYQQMESDLITWISTADPAVIAKNSLVRLLRLAQIASGAVRDEQQQDHVIDDSKRLLLEELLEGLPASEPVVVFARFKTDLAAIHLAARNLGRLSGELSGDRGPTHDLPRWQRGYPGDPVILAVQIQAGSVAIDLTRARIAVYYSIGFSLADYLQSRARIYRTGQTRPVMYYHLLSRDTVDEVIREALSARQDLVSSVLKELPCYRHHPLKNGPTNQPSDLDPRFAASPALLS